GTTFDASALSEYSYTNTNHISSTLLSNSSYIFANGTKIEATCGTGYTEYADTTGSHYFQCVNGTWTAVGGCRFTGCTALSPVYDKNNNKISDRLFQMTFGSGNTSTTVYPILYCSNVSGASTELSNSSSSLVTPVGTTATCGDHSGTPTDTDNSNRHYVCTNPNSTANGGYWKMKVASCDLSTIKSATGYTAYLSTSSMSTIVTLANKSTQYRYPSTSNWSKLYHVFNSAAEGSTTRSSTITCTSSGTWSLSGSIRYNYTGSMQYFTVSKYVPLGTSVTLQLYGGAGGYYYGETYKEKGGNGGYATGTLKTSSSVASISIGVGSGATRTTGAAASTAGTSPCSCNGGSGGSPKGKNVYYGSSGGACTCAIVNSTKILIAGGGGGATRAGAGGAGGGSSGGDGSGGGSTVGGGTQSGRGACNYDSCSCDSNTSYGYNGQTYNKTTLTEGGQGGGGGGGYYGGGGEKGSGSKNSKSGGGGSGYAASNSYFSGSTTQGGGPSSPTSGKSDGYAIVSW
ncbi:MAG: hypothetical protein IJ853_03625, partial [Rickettsiales bacterium]|nr:hypothetical protein [Rickettsiales bacterium]